VCSFLIVYTYLCISSDSILKRFIGKKCSCAHTNITTRTRIVCICVSKWLVSSYLIVLLYNGSTFFPSVRTWKCSALCLFLQMNFTHTQRGGSIECRFIKSVRSIWIASTLHVFFSLLHTDKNEDQIATNEKRDFRKYRIDRIGDDISKKKG
jgi:hypothetical protein